MTTEQPLVSIVVITYQNAPFLDECISGILKQSYSNFELIIAEDGSTDDSLQIIENYAKNNKQIKVLSTTVNRGVSENINIAFEHCNGKYICLIAGDDAMYSNKIEKQVEFLENNSDFDMCFHNVDVYDNNTGTILFQWMDKFRPTRFPPDALFRANWNFRKDNRKTPSGSWFGRTSYMINGKNDKRTSQSHEFIFTMGMYAAKPSGKWHTLNEVLGKYRVHNNSLSNSKPNWYKSAEEISVCYAIAKVKFPQYGRLIHSEAANWWFMQLLYNQVPQGTYKKYAREFIRDYGLHRYLYMVVCKILLGKSFTPIRKIFKTVSNKKIA